jgi:Family of unknown function (DUF5677)
VGTDLISDAETRNQLRSLYAPDFEAVDSLLDFADRVLAQWHVPARKQDGIVAAEVARSTKMLRAGLLLSEQGYGEQAAMICRSMFESMAVMHWVVAHPDEAVERFEKYDRYIRVLWWESMVKAGWADPNEKPPPVLTDDERAELCAEFGTYGEKLWTGHRNMPALLADIEDQWPEKLRGELWTYFDIAHRMNNRLLHSTPTATRGTIGEAESEQLVFTSGPTAVMIEQALFCLFYIYDQVLGLIFEHYNPAGYDEYRTVVDRGVELLRAKRPETA